jgi:hypothetical protein
VLEALDNKTLEAFCKFNILTMEQLLRRVNIDSDMIKVFVICYFNFNGGGGVKITI